MPARAAAPLGAPCWIDLFTLRLRTAPSCSTGSSFGCDRRAHRPEYGGYVNFRRGDALIAGMMRNDGSAGAPDVWSTYLAVADAQGHRGGRGGRRWAGAGGADAGRAAGRRRGAGRPRRRRDRDVAAGDAPRVRPVRGGRRRRCGTSAARRPATTRRPRWTSIGPLDVFRAWGQTSVMSDYRRLPLHHRRDRPGHVTNRRARWTRARRSLPRACRPVRPIYPALVPTWTTALARRRAARRHRAAARRGHPVRPAAPDRRPDRGDDRRSPRCPDPAPSGHRAWTGRSGSRPRCRRRR